jgi:hypothetical protein
MASHCRPEQDPPRRPMAGHSELMETRSGLAYEEIGTGYAGLRCAEPAWDHAIRRGLADARSVVNIGAGSGSWPWNRPP